MDVTYTRQPGWILEGRRRKKPLLAVSVLSLRLVPRFERFAGLIGLWTLRNQTSMRRTGGNMQVLSKTPMRNGSQTNLHSCDVG